ncbi:MAG: FkbM family methyltransferase [Phycisphaerales bacterium]
MAFDSLIKLTRRYNLKPRGVVHVGGHIGEETQTYAALGIKRQFWVEPQPTIYEMLVKNAPPSDLVRHANVACGARRDRLTLNVIPQRAGESFGLSSLLKPTDALRDDENTDVAETIEVPIVPLDDLLREQGLDPSGYNLLVIDTQGYELEVMKGATGLIGDHIDYVFTEVSRTPLYEGSCLEHEIDAFLEGLGLQRVYSRLSQRGHGDALYIREALLPALLRFRLKVLGPRVRLARARSTPKHGAARSASTT